MRVPLLDLQAQYRPLREEIRVALEEVCDTQQFILGPRVEALERAVAAYSGTAYAVGVSSGSDALLAVLMALEVGPGDAVVTTPYTFFSTAAAIVRTGATPVFADIQPDTFNINPEAVEAVLRHSPERFRRLRFRVLMPVHLFGQAADIDRLLALARTYDLAVVEDAAQAIGAQYPSAEGPRRAGSLGIAGCLSFYPTKNLGGFGEGGMILTQDGDLAERLRRLRNQGMSPKYHHAVVGWNFRLDALQAAVLAVKLRYLEGWHEARRRNAWDYDHRFSGTAVKPPVAVYRNSGLPNYHIYHQYVVRCPQRDIVARALQAAGIGYEIYYPVPLHLQPCFRGLGYREGDFPESERAARESLALPVYPELNEAMRAYVAEALLRAVDAAAA